MGWDRVQPRQIDHSCKIPKLDVAKHGYGDVWFCDDCRQYWQVRNGINGIYLMATGEFKPKEIILPALPVILEKEEGIDNGISNNAS